MRHGVLAAIGNTPLVRIGFDTPATVYAKLEFANPGGSLKDRSACFMIEYAEQKGLLKPSGTIVEASSGNQGIALAMIGAVKGYRVIITTAKTTSSDKVQTMRAYGAEVILCESTLYADDPNNYRNVAKAVHAMTPGAFMPDQFHNPVNPLGHYSWLGPEIWKQTKGRITHFFAAAGSGGTVSGVGRFLREQTPRVRIHAVDAAGSFYSKQGKAEAYSLDGMGVDALWPTFDLTCIDEVIGVTDDEGFGMMRDMPKRFGILAGPSSGAVAAAVGKSLSQFKKGDVVVMLCGDSGRAYLSKGYFSQESGTQSPSRT
jgi:cystathionine beta-synthase